MYVIFNNLKLNNCRDVSADHEIILFNYLVTIHLQGYLKTKDKKL